jgi:Protein of unknown function (DUF3455)
VSLPHRTTLAALLSSLLAACAGVSTSGVPAALQPAAGERLLLTVAARGVQIYECRSQAGATPAWTLTAPDAELFDANGQRIGSHGAGPHWVAHDGSRLVGSLKARADAPSPTAIPWLLLSVRDVGPAGRFSGVTSIQRVNTAGGNAPASGCDTTALGRSVRIPYTADYRLFRDPGVLATGPSYPL